jgi:hypothetical protein
MSALGIEKRALHIMKGRQAFSYFWFVSVGFWFVFATEAPATRGAAQSF